jgi:hypothetical protein
MKNFAILALIVLSVSFSYGQCNKDLLLTSSKTEYFDGSDALQRSVDEESTIEINKTQVIIKGGDNPVMISTIDTQSIACDWSTAFKEGKTVFKALFEDQNKEVLHVKFTIEGKAGVVTALMEIDETPDRKIKVTLTSFKEK